jgi:drug/metabolite transporter, DME family
VERIGFTMSAVLAAATSGHRARRGGLLLILLAAILWGTVGVTTRAIFTLAETTALSVAFLRLALAVPVLTIGTATVLGRRGFQATPRHLLLMAGMGVLLATYQFSTSGRSSASASPLPPWSLSARRP